MSLGSDTYGLHAGSPPNNVGTKADYMMKGFRQAERPAVCELLLLQNLDASGCSLLLSEPAAWDEQESDDEENDDETRRRKPHDLIVGQGMPPSPGTQVQG